MDSLTFPPAVLRDTSRSCPPSSVFSHRKNSASGAADSIGRGRGGVLSLLGFSSAPAIHFAASERMEELISDI